MLQSFRRADFDALAQIWSGFFPPPYRVDPQQLKRNTVECPVFDWGASVIHAPDGPPLGFVVVKKSPQGILYEGQKRDESFLCAIAYDQAQTAIDMLASVKTVLRDRGIHKLHFGQDAWHFFPGCPVDHTPLRNLLTVEGFVEGGEILDLERDLGDYEALVAVPKGLTVRPLAQGERDLLKEFLEDEFPGRWAYEVIAKVESEDCTECVVGLFEKASLVGFARVQKWDDKIPMAGGVWRQALGERWGIVGPIGIASRLRAKGLGHGLLGQTLLYLKGLGVERCVVDWTDMEGFYGKHGFKVARRYKAMNLNLETQPASKPSNWDVGLH